MQSLALKCKSEVTLVRLKPEIIQLQCKTHWTTLDPYSDLEEVSDRGGSETPEGLSDTEPSGVHCSVVGGHVLRKRKRSYSAQRERRSTSANTFYRDMCNDKEVTKRKPVKKVTVPSLKVPS